MGQFNDIFEYLVLILFTYVLLTICSSLLVLAALLVEYFVYVFFISSKVIKLKFLHIPWKVGRKLGSNGYCVDIFQHIMDIHSILFGVWVRSTTNDSIWGIRCGFVPVQMASISDWAATNACYCRAKCPANSLYARLCKFVMHSRFIQTGLAFSSLNKWTNISPFFEYLIEPFLFNRLFMPDAHILWCFAKSMDNEIWTLHLKSRDWNIAESLCRYPWGISKRYFKAQWHLLFS